MVLQPDGKILVAGSTNVGGNYDFAVARLLANGLPDNTFGVGGRTTIDMGADEFANAMALGAAVLCRYRLMSIPFYVDAVLCRRFLCILGA